ncbi:MAG: serine/threonine-protein kinase [Pirellulaceae bacterium]
MFQPKTKPLDVSARFRLDRHAFTGTMSKFHVATEIETGNVYGIKFLDKEKLALFRDRFKGVDRPEEGEIGMTIDHPRVAKTYEYGFTTTGVEYILMEYIDGPGLNTILREPDGRLLENRLFLIRQMAEALHAVHEAGFIHRDVCPRNFICFNDYSWLKLIDFGLTIPNLPPFRLPGNRTGTPQYMAPEIVRRRPTDQRVDIFAFGVTAYRFLALEHPWGSTDVTAMAALSHDQKPAEDITKFRPNLDPKLVKAVHKCLEINPDRRFDSLKQFLSSISTVKTEDNVS